MIKTNKIFGIFDLNLKSILFIGLLLRLISVVFSKGYGMHDDHFLIIEAAQSWIDGTDYNWLPWNQVNPVPSGHSFFYVGIHFILFSIFDFVGLTNPETKMFLVRLIHAVYSLLVISLSYKITLKLSNKTTANTVGLLLAFLWFMPFLSVRNLVEIVSIPPLLASVWIIIKDDKYSIKKYLLAGIIGGLAFSIRFQTSLFLGGVGLVLLINKQWKETFFYGAGVILSIVGIQGGIDFFVWGKPFTELTQYVMYNIIHKNEYGAGAWYNYILVLSGLTIPPLGLLLFLGMFNIKKKLLILFIPTILFFAFHSYFPNKQERFIMPIYPMFLILGFIGIDNLLKGKLNKKIWYIIYKYSFIFFLLINFILLPIVTVTYSKKARVETMHYLYTNNASGAILYEGTNKGGSKLLPQFYSGYWAKIYNIKNEDNYNAYENMPDSVKPKIEYYIFYGNDRLEERKKRIESIFEPLQIDYKSTPGFVDWLLYTVNPKNSNDTIFIYKPKNQLEKIN